MDTSEKYIKMCEKAFPDLFDKDYVWRMGSLFYDRLSATALKNSANTDQFFIPIAWNGPWPELKKHNRYIPLYQQDQLQEMVQDDLRIRLFDNEAHMTLKIFYDAVNMNLENNQYYWLFDSMEQLWLAFVMKEKFNKVWDDEKKEWVKE